MSGSIKLKHASGNGVIIAAPSSNPAADRTLTLPSDADGVIAKTDASGNLAVTGDLTVDTDTLKVDSSNNRVGVGTTSPDRTIHCHNSSNTTNVRTKFSNGTTGEGASDGFEIGINGSDPAQAVLVNYENSPMAFFTNATERVRIQAGGGISFNGDTAAANALDDYEEGEHTLTTNSNLTAHSSYNKADYTKVGNMVTVTFLLYIQSVSSNDVLTVSLPFANRNESYPRMCQAVGSVMHKYVNTGNVGMIPYLDSGSSVLKFYQLADDASWSVINNADLNANDELYVTITYKTAT